MFCPKCGGILIPKKDGNKKWLACTCGYKTKDIKDAKEVRLKDTAEKKEDVEVIEKSDAQQSLPEVDAECPKCHNTRAFYWLVQTRAGDEAETRFFRCTKCKHTWREYD